MDRRTFVNSNGMRIGINAFFFGKATTGSGQYTEKLLRELGRVEGNDYFLFLFGKEEASAKWAFPKSFREHSLHTPFDSISGDLAKLWFEQVSFPRACSLLRLDIAHVPYFASPLFPKTPTVVTIHDLIPLILPLYRGSVLVRLYTRLVAIAARRADVVITDSESSKEDVIRILKIPEERVRVIYLAADEMFRPVNDEARLSFVRRKYGLPRLYLLYLGGFDQRKNVSMLIRAFALLNRGKTAKRVNLVIAGRLPLKDTPFFPDPRSLVEELGIGEEVVFTGWVEEEDKPALYSGALAFVFPSLYEGFGLPPLEAMSCGVPVIASNRASLPEVVGDGGLLFDPEDAEGLAYAIELLLSDEALRAELQRKALAQSARFSWKRCALETLAVYQEIG
jgi:glycosyltransferase involved in cell wall biosynthesis